jgi:hypothetical protein
MRLHLITRISARMPPLIDESLAEPTEEAVAVRPRGHPEVLAPPLKPDNDRCPGGITGLHGLPQRAEDVAGRERTEAGG